MFWLQVNFGLYVRFSGETSVSNKYRIAAWNAVLLN